MKYYYNVDEIPEDPCMHDVRRSVLRGYIDPTMELCRSRFTVSFSRSLWNGHPQYHEWHLKVLNYRIKTWEDWDRGYGNEHLEKIKKIEAKKERVRQARVRGGIGKQSPELKAILLEPITFKHSSGICVTVLPQRSVRDVAKELSKISFCECTQLAKVLVRGSGYSKGWLVIQSSSTGA